MTISSTAQSGGTGHHTADVAVRVDNVHKAYGPAGTRVLALDGVSLEASVGEFLCLVGASGCGKSTLLGLISGLDKPGSGLIEVRGRPALLFQDSALFPWLTVGRNIELAMSLRGVPRPERRWRVLELLETVHLDGAVNKRPHELSGGMRQRVALARALAQDADILLMDEPFGALDAITRDLLHDELERVWAATGTTVIFVTHNVREAVRLGDRVLVLSSRPGRVVAEFAVKTSRPRRIESPEVGTTAAAVTQRLRMEVRRHAHDGTAAAGPPAFPSAIHYEEEHHT
jgi:NitT/TauT family transport system ATP-binding protein